MRYAKLLFIFSQLILLFISTGLGQEQTYWWNDAVFYEIYVRSFYDSDGDGTGDLQGIIEKLDYLNDGDPETDTDLGITGIWLMPISPSPSIHGYDVINYREIESDYGTLEDFEALVSACHERGIHIIIDFVMNHSSIMNDWFISSSNNTESPYRNWYIWEDTYPGYQGPWGQQVWFASHGDWYFGLFSSGMPDLNYYEQEVRDEMFDIAAYWLNDYDVDGFRLDAIRHLVENGQQFQNVPETFEVLREFRQAYKAVNPQALAVGEVWDNTAGVLPYVDGTGMDFCFEFETAEDIRNGVRFGQPATILNQMAYIINAYPYFQFAPFLSNHDMERVFEELNQNVAKMKLAAAVYLTIPGIPFIYYGEEVGMIGSGGDEYSRTPMQWAPEPGSGGFTSGTPWFPMNANYLQYNVESLQSDPNSLWHWYRKLVQARYRHSALRTGEFIALSDTYYNLMAYARTDTSETVVALMNFNITLLTNPLVSLANSSMMPGYYEVTDLFTESILDTLQINFSGGFSNWETPVILDDYEIGLLQLSPIWTYIPGDLNDDELTDILDIVTAVFLILDDIYDERADYNQDGVLDILDVLLMVDAAMGG